LTDTVLSSKGHTESTTKGWKAGVGVDGMQPSGMLSATYSHNRTSNVSESGSKSTVGPQGDMGITFSITKDEWGSRPTCTTTLIYVFNMKAPLASIDDVRQKLLLVADFSLTFKHLLRKHVISSAITSGFCATHRADDIVVGGVVGYPKCGKTTFFNTLLQLGEGSRKFAVTETPYLFRHHITNFMFDNAVRNVAFIDTRGYYFDIDHPDCAAHDMNLLEKFVQGLPSETKFSKTADLNTLAMDVQNAPTHLILALTARDLYRQVPPNKLRPATALMPSENSAPTPSTSTEISAPGWGGWFRWWQKRYSPRDSTA